MRYTFGGISIDTGARTVSDAGVPVHLTRKAFDLLMLLLESRPDIVSKEQIYARLWPDTFVSEASLQTLVHEIRQAIDDRPSGQSWIRTVHGVGYRFEGDVTVDAMSQRAAVARPAAWLVGESMRIALSAGENILGRGVDDAIEIDHPAISRRHARIVVAETTTVEDLGSKNGTWLNEVRLTAAHPLADDDVVSLGSVRFVFRRVREPRPTETIDPGEVGG